MESIDLPRSQHDLTARIYAYFYAKSGDFSISSISVRKLFLTLRSLKKGFSCKVVGGELDGAWRGEAGDRVHILTFSMAERVHDKDSNPFGH